MTHRTLEALLDEGLERGFYAGAAAEVRGEDGTRFALRVGRARLHPDAVDTADSTLWDLASLTKPLAGAALTLRLVASRQLALDDEVRRFHDGWKRTKFEGVTIRRLLAHTGGQAAWFPCYVRGEGRDAYRRTLSALDADSPPGTRATYSCLGYLVLADVVEHVGAAPVDRLFRDEVAVPLGVERDLLFDPSPEDRQRCAGGERDDATERQLVADRGLSYAGFRTGAPNGETNDGNAFRRGGGVSLNSGLFGTASAVSTVAEAWLRRDPRLLPEPLFERAVSDATGELRAGRGLGWEMAAATNAAGTSLPSAAYGHTGFTGTSLWIDPVRRRVLVLAANRLHPSARDADMNEFRRRFHEAAADL